jgi:hypothetical protein
MNWLDIAPQFHHRNKKKTEPANPVLAAKENASVLTVMFFIGLQFGWEARICRSASLFPLCA